MSKEFLVFKEVVDESRKTKMWGVSSAHDGAYLGSVRFWPAWRCFVLVSDEGVIWSGACLHEVGEFCLARTKEWKEVG